MCVIYFYTIFNSILIIQGYSCILLISLIYNYYLTYIAISDKGISDVDFKSVCFK